MLNPVLTGLFNFPIFDSEFEYKDSNNDEDSSYFIRKNRPQYAFREYNKYKKSGGKLSFKQWKQQKLFGRYKKM